MLAAALGRSSATWSFSFAAHHGFLLRHDHRGLANLAAWWSERRRVGGAPALDITCPAIPRSSSSGQPASTTTSPSRLCLGGRRARVGPRAPRSWRIISRASVQDEGARALGIDTFRCQDGGDGTVVLPIGRGRAPFEPYDLFSLKPNAVFGIRCPSKSSFGTSWAAAGDGAGPPPFAR